MAKRPFIGAVTVVTAFLAIFIVPIAYAQQCEPRGIRLWTQAQIDNFQQEHGPCDQLDSLYIRGDDISNLDGLSGIRELRWSLQIVSNPVLSDVSGLSSLQRVGTFLLFQDNPALKSLDGLVSLTEVGESMGIVDNDGLRNINGLNGLQTVGCGISISYNELLENLDGLSSLTEVGVPKSHWACHGTTAFSIYLNPSLTNVDGLRSLERLGSLQGGSHLLISQNSSLLRVDALVSLVELWGSLGISQNPKLEFVGGFDSLTLLPEGMGIGGNPALTEIQGPALLENIGGLGIGENDALTTISGFEALRRVYGHLEVIQNATLSDLFDLTGLVEVGGRLDVQSNPSLMHCQAFARLLDAVDDAWQGPGPGPDLGEGGVPDVGLEVRIGDNLPGCNSIDEILESEQLEVLNAGLSDAWFYPETDGQGFFIIVLPAIEQVFLAWFTYDVERPPGDVDAILEEPGHRWITAQGPYKGNEALLEVWVTHGGTFDSSEPPVARYPDGEILLEFQTCNAGSVSYDIPSIGLQGSVPVQRITLDNVPLCYQLRTGQPN